MKDPKRKGFSLTRNRGSMMEVLINYLNKIKELLDQIYYITQNQTNVLLEGEKEDGRIAILEEMSEYKNTVMNEVERVEADFQEHYYVVKGELGQNNVIIKLQEKVGEVLKLKEKIIAIEQQNLILMKEQSSRNRGKMKIPQNSQKVIESYKKHIKK